MKRSEERHLHELLHELNFKVDFIMATLQDILTGVRAESDIDDSIVTLLNNISQQLKSAQATQDPAALQSVIDQIEVNKKKISDAVTANTPVQPV